MCPASWANHGSKLTKVGKAQQHNDDDQHEDQAVLDHVLRGAAQHVVSDMGDQAVIGLWPLVAIVRRRLSAG